jgi:phytoene synthase
MISSSALREQVRRADPDRYFCSLFAPAELRERLWLLYAFNHQLARAREVAREPMLALIRLAWWREVVEGAAKAHEIANPLAEALSAGWYGRADLLALIEAREAETEPEIADLAAFMAYVRGTAGKLARIAGNVLGVDDDAVETLGTAYGISGILRAARYHAASGRRLLPADGTPEETLIVLARECLRAKAPKPALPAILPAVLARRDLGRAYQPRGLGDRLAVIRAALSGRV